MRRELGSIMQKKGTKNVWIVRVSTGTDKNGKQKRKSKTVRGTKKDAAKALNKMLAELGLAGEGVTFREFCETRYIPWHMNTYPRKDSSAKWLRDINHCIDIWGDTRLDRMKRDVMEIWASDDGTKSWEISKMKAAMKKAVQWEYIDRDPLANVKPQRNAPSKGRFSLDDVTKILDAVRDSDIEAGVLLMLMGGMRMAEALAMDWERIDFKTGHVKIDRTFHWENGHGWFEDTKNASSRRIITLDSNTLARLKEIRTVGNVVRLGAVMTSWKTGERLSPNTFQHKWRDMVKPVLGDRHLPPKNLRHTHASLCLDNGVSIEAIARRLGHSSTKLTESTYAESPEIESGCAEAMQALFGA